MINWIEIEEWARTREDIAAQVTRIDRERIEVLQDHEASRRPVKARVAASLVRIGARLDPKTVVLHESGEDALFEGRLAAYLR
jgi:hypothetical protein